MRQKLKALYNSILLPGRPGINLKPSQLPGKHTVSQLTFLLYSALSDIGYPIAPG